MESRSIKKSIDGTITIVKRHNGHAREPDNTIVVNNFRNVLKHRAATENAILKNIYDEEARRDMVAAALYPWSTAESVMRLARRNSLPNLPANLRALATLFEDDQLQRFGCCDAGFFKGCIQDIENKTSVIFACPQLIRSVLENNIQEVHADATFKVVPANMGRVEENEELALLNNENALKSLRLLMCLPLLPAHSIENGFLLIVAFARNHAVNLDNLFNYYQRYWLRNVGPEIVSVYGLPRRTNNNIESFHNALKMKFSVNHPSLWIFLDHLTHLNKNYHVIVNQLNNNLVPTRHLRIKFLVNSRKIKTASEQLDLGLISIWQFLQRCSYASAAYEQRQRNWDLNNDEDAEEPILDDPQINIPLVMLHEPMDNIPMPVPQEREVAELPLDANNDPQAAENRSLCMVCIEDTSEHNATKYIVLPCGHAWICHNCMIQLSTGHNAVCPICRTDQGNEILCNGPNSDEAVNCKYVDTLNTLEKENAMQICALVNADVDDDKDIVMVEDEVIMVEDVDKNNLLDNNFTSFNYFKKPMPSGINDFFKFHPKQPDTEKLFKSSKAYFRSSSIKRQWLSFDDQSKSLFCSVCLAFSSEPNLFTKGLSICTHVYQRIEEHEASKTHMSCSESYLLHTRPLSRYLQTSGIDFIKSQELVNKALNHLKEIQRGMKDVKSEADEFIIIIEEIFENKHNMDILIEKEFPKIRCWYKKKMADEITSDQPLLNAEEKLTVEVHNIIFDKTISCMEERFSSNKKLYCDLACLSPNNFKDLHDKELPSDTLLKLSEVLKKFDDKFTLLNWPAAKERWEKLRRCFSNARNRQREEKKWTQSNLAAEQEDVSEESEVEENTPSQSEEGKESGHDFQDNEVHHQKNHLCPIEMLRLQQWRKLTI
ncbi:hypothetical protein ACI65C_013232 [Semiaphis heraclei]